MEEEETNMLLEQTKAQEEKELERVTKILCTRPQFFNNYVPANSSSAEHDSEFLKTYHLRGNQTNNETDDTEDLQPSDFSLLGKTSIATYGTTNLPESVTVDWKDKAYEGYLFKRLSSHEWRKYFFVFIPDIFELRYYRSREKYYKNPSEYRGVICMTWYNKARANEEDRLFQAQLRNSTTQVCTTRIVVFSTTRHYVISSESDDDLEQWVTRWDAVMNTLYTPEELQIKKDAMRHQIPLFQQQARAQLEYYKMVVKALESAGLFASKPVNKEKEGYLYLQRSNKKWRQYYFVLMSHSLSYFHLDDKNFPRGVISLLSIVEVATEPKIVPPDNDNAVPLNSSTNNEVSEEPRTPPTPRLTHSDDSDKEKKRALVSEMVHNQPASRKSVLLSSAERRDLQSSSEEEQETVFIIRTHLRTYRLKAKHEAAMNDWINTINRVRTKDKSSKTPTVDRKVQQEVVYGQKVNFNAGERIEIQYGPKKLFKLKKPGVITIGRSSKSDIVLDKDPRISRNHSKIEVRSSGVVVGSSVSVLIPSSLWILALLVAHL